MNIVRQYCWVNNNNALYFMNLQVCFNVKV